MKQLFASLCLALVALVFSITSVFAQDDRPIGVFDSGIGGLTVLEKLMAHPGLAGESFTYLGDQANMPYGNYAAEGKAAYLRELAVKDALFLVSDGYFANGGEETPAGVKRPAKIVVIACNTATAYGRDAADAVFKCVGARQKVIGVINAGVRSTLRTLKAAEAIEPFAVGVMATPGTIASGAYPRTIADECAKQGVKVKVDVFSQGCPGLADAIELGTADAAKIAHDNLVALVSQYRQSGATVPLKAVILGCTHYPFLLSTLEKTRAELGLDFIFVDPAVDTAEECYQSLKASGMLADRPADAGSVRMFVSVPSASLPAACVAADGTLETRYKYGRDPGRDEVTTKFVPLENGTVDRASLARLVRLLPLTCRALANGNGPTRPRTCAAAKCGLPLDDPGLRWILAFFSFCLGACIASFLNVVIWRVPRGESIVSPPSHCPKCNAEIKWYQNIPILAWLCLRGRCANCKAPISPRYILIELLGGGLFLAAFLKFGLSAPLGYSVFFLLVMWLWISLMIVGSFIDFDHQLLPDFVTVGGMVLGLVIAAVDSTVLWLAHPQDALLLKLSPLMGSVGGLVFGFGLLWLIRFFGSKAFGREAMGMGDVFLMGAVGALFGPVAVLVTMILSSVFGSIAGLGLMALSKIRLGRFVAIPYGPYICLGCLAWMFYGTELVGAYLALLK